jgi:hypothetical protein
VQLAGERQVSTWQWSPARRLRQTAELGVQNATSNGALWITSSASRTKSSHSATSAKRAVLQNSAVILHLQGTGIDVTIGAQVAVEDAAVRRLTTSMQPISMTR